MTDMFPEFISMSALMGAILALVFVLIARAFTRKKIKPLTPADLIHSSIQNLEEYKGMVHAEHIAVSAEMTAEEVIHIIDERRTCVRSIEAIIKDMNGHLAQFPN